MDPRLGGTRSGADRPYRGRDGVEEYAARVFGTERGPRVLMSEPIVDGDRASISWWTTLVDDDEDATLAGTSVLTFDADGVVMEQWDTWNHRPGRIPPGNGAPFGERAVDGG